MCAYAHRHASALHGSYDLMLAKAEVRLCAWGESIAERVEMMSSLVASIEVKAHGTKPNARWMRHAASQPGL